MQAKPRARYPPPPPRPLIPTPQRQSPVLVLHLHDQRSQASPPRSHNTPSSTLRSAPSTASRPRVTTAPCFSRGCVSRVSLALCGGGGGGVRCLPCRLSSATRTSLAAPPDSAPSTSPRCCCAVADIVCARDRSAGYGHVSSLLVRGVRSRVSVSARRHGRSNRGERKDSSGIFLRGPDWYWSLGVGDKGIGLVMGWVFFAGGGGQRGLGDGKVGW
ncbi:hypothetical protein BDU57DRAFT_577210, partial [Ampelomyces quisqualis]